VIFDSVRPQQKIAQEEIFGPVLSVLSFTDEEEAIRIANNTIYGLSAILWTRDLGRAHRMTYSLHAGWIVVNATGKRIGGPGSGVLSIGGHRESGIGVGRRTRGTRWLPEPHGRAILRMKLLAADEPPPFIVERPQGRSPFVIVVDHAGTRIPRRLGNLGLPDSQLRRHVAWDIGALAVARKISTALDAPLVAQPYSRLVIDCNREPAVDASIPTMAESIEVPGNIGLSEEDITVRRAEIFEPYHAQLRALLDLRRTASRLTILVAQHTMTDVFKGIRRAMHAAVLYYRDRRFAGLVLQRLRRETALVIGENEPYVVDETHYTILRYAEAYSLPYVEVEVRQDLVSDERGQAEWAARIGTTLRVAERELRLLPCRSC